MQNSRPRKRNEKSLRKSGGFYNKAINRILKRAYWAILYSEYNNLKNNLKKYKIDIRRIVVS